MICPVCHQDTIIVEHRKIELDYCLNCRGVWFDAGELELLLEASGLKEHYRQNQMVPAAEADTREKKLRCPICRRRMKKVFIDLSKHVVVDTCPDGHGLWFDSGEIEHVLTSLAEKAGTGPSQEVINFIGQVFKPLPNPTE